MRVKRSELPRLLGVSRQQVHVDIKDGFYRPGHDGLFDLAEVRSGRAARDPFHGGRREALAPGRPVPGPAIIVESNQTLVVEPGWQAELTTLGDLVRGSRVNLEIDMLARYLARWRETA